MVIVNFIRDKEVGMFARAKRLGKGVPAIIQESATCKAGLEDSDDGVKQD